MNGGGYFQTDFGLGMFWGVIVGVLLGVSPIYITCIWRMLVMRAERRVREGSK